MGLLNVFFILADNLGIIKPNLLLYRKRNEFMSVTIHLN
jgi:hypothetical protein